MRNRSLRIRLIAFEDGISCVGFRRISAVVKSRYALTTTYIYNVAAGSGSRVTDFLLSKPQPSQAAQLNPTLFRELADADVIGLSCVSLFATHAKQAIAELRRSNPSALIVWGGVHPSVFPEDAIAHADAVCIGEGEKSFLSLLDRVERGESIETCEGFWVRSPGGVVKNRLTSLLTPEELGQMPFQDYGFDIRYVTRDHVEPMTREVYQAVKGSAYMTMWVLGCPFHCAYCSNDTFLRNDPEYGRIRYADPKRVVDELCAVLEKHDYVSYVEIVDDNIFMAHLRDLERFAAHYKERVGLPMFLPGLHPSAVSRKKLQLLVDAGLRKVRMGIQSGSQRTLAFYQRKTSRADLLEAAEIIGSFYPRIVPPNYDIIIDNPLENEADKAETLSLLRALKRPYLLYVYSLRVLPGTRLDDFAREHPEHRFRYASQSYQEIQDKKTGLLVFLLAVVRPSDRVFRLAEAAAGNPLLNRVGFPMVRLAYLMKRFYYESKTSNLEPLAVLSPSLARAAVRLRKRLRRLSSSPAPPSR